LRRLGKYFAPSPAQRLCLRGDERRNTEVLNSNGDGNPARGNGLFVGVHDFSRAIVYTARACPFSIGELAGYLPAAAPPQTPPSKGGFAIKTVSPARLDGMVNTTHYLTTCNTYQMGNPSRIQDSDLERLPSIKYLPSILDFFLAFCPNMV